MKLKLLAASTAFGLVALGGLAVGEPGAAAQVTGHTGVTQAAYAAKCTGLTKKVKFTHFHLAHKKVPHHIACTIAHPVVKVAKAA
jgi:hypothetical protein